MLLGAVTCIVPPVPLVAEESSTKVAIVPFPLVRLILPPSICPLAKILSVLIFPAALKITSPAFPASEKEFTIPALIILLLLVRLISAPPVCPSERILPVAVISPAASREIAPPVPEAELESSTPPEVLIVPPLLITVILFPPDTPLELISCVTMLPAALSSITPPLPLEELLGTPIGPVTLIAPPSLVILMLPSLTSPTENISPVVILPLACKTIAPP